MGKSILFWGSSEESKIVLEKLSRFFDFAGVVTNPPKPKGRGKKLLKNIVHEKAEELGIKQTLTPHVLDNKLYESLKKLNPEVSVVVSYGKLIPEEFLRIPSIDTINLHFSLLPKWRGASPVERALLNGEDEGGISIIRVVKKLDAGPLYFSKKLSFNKYYAYEIRKEFSQIGANELVKIIPELKDLKLKEQKGETTYAKKIKKEEGKIFWKYSSDKIVRMVRAFTPWPSAYFFYKGKRISIIYAEVFDEETFEKPGTIVDYMKGSEGGIYVQTGEKLVFIKKIKPESKSILNAYDYFINGLRLKVGDSLEIN